MYSRKRIKRGKNTRRRHNRYQRRTIRRKNVKRRTRRRKRQRSRRKYSGGAKSKAASSSRTLRRAIKYQLITDVDDTLHPAGSSWHTVLGHIPIAGVDVYGDRGTYYPCVDSFHQEMFKTFQLPTVIVSANPKKITGEKLAKKTRKLHGEGANTNVIAHHGELWASTKSTLSNAVGRFYAGHVANIAQKKYDDNWDLDNYESMAAVKIKTITNHVRQMKQEAADASPPWEYRAIWIGDNGQGDLLAAEALLREKIIYAALIHYVEPRKPSGEDSEFRYNDSGNEVLFSFRNYSDAIQYLKRLDPTNLGFLNCPEKKESSPMTHPTMARQDSYKKSYDNIKRSEEIKKIKSKKDSSSGKAGKED